ncbi:pacifastin-like protease inhibitor cvp4 [Trichogramma pretiosum]|uniref:pacifastin-like protease inhibitor cvp4 n=1 Tax=Trichogramma pretiosum TaxID=7493 RepID=UPI0006C9CA38|nr:pacifastin-like protease inhibitor cvp4 [Trichogramma pretiosum]
MKRAFFILLIVASISATFGESNGVEKQVCEPKSTFKNYCNICFCSDDGLTADCGRKLCDPNVWNPDGTRRPLAPLSLYKSLKQVCKPSSPFKMDCNYCTCSDDGTKFACTRMACPKGYTGVNLFKKSAVHKIVAELARICEPNTFFKMDCNNCICDETGFRPMCTKMYCPKGFTGAKSAVHKRVAGSAQVCEPNQGFKLDCNHCRCNSFGTKYMCTKMLCPRYNGNEDHAMIF